MSGKHSPTPYAIEDGVGFHTLRSLARGDKVATVATSADAEFIAAACNHHADLLRLVERRLAALRLRPLVSVSAEVIAWYAEAEKLVEKLRGGAF